MTVIYPESAVSDLMVRINGQIGTFLEFYLALPRNGQTAERHISESSVSGRKHVILGTISFHLGCKIRLEFLQILKIKLLKTYYVCILSIDKGKD